MSHFGSVFVIIRIITLIALLIVLIFSLIKLIRTKKLRYLASMAVMAVLLSVSFYVCELPYEIKVKESHLTEAVEMLDDKLIEDGKHFPYRSWGIRGDVSKSNLTKEEYEHQIYLYDLDHNYKHIETKDGNHYFVGKYWLDRDYEYFWYPNHSTAEIVFFANGKCVNLDYKFTHPLADAVLHPIVASELLLGGKKVDLLKIANSFTREDVEVSLSNGDKAMSELESEMAEWEAEEEIFWSEQFEETEREEIAR